MFDGEPELIVESGAAKSEGVGSADAFVFGDHAEGGDVLSDNRSSAQHGQSADAAELVDEDIPGEDRAVFDDHVAGDPGLVGDGDAVADSDIVAEVDERHQEGSVAD